MADLNVVAAPHAANHVAMAAELRRARYIIADERETMRQDDGMIDPEMRPFADKLAAQIDRIDRVLEAEVHTIIPTPGRLDFALPYAEWAIIDGAIDDPTDGGVHALYSEGSIVFAQMSNGELRAMPGNPVPAPDAQPIGRVLSAGSSYGLGLNADGKRGAQPDL